jgi:hypothetical protein
MAVPLAKSVTPPAGASCDRIPKLIFAQALTSGAPRSTRARPTFSVHISQPPSVLSNCEMLHLQLFIDPFDFIANASPYHYGYYKFTIPFALPVLIAYI